MEIMVLITWSFSVLTGKGKHENQYHIVFMAQNTTFFSALVFLLIVHKVSRIGTCEELRSALAPWLKYIYLYLKAISKWAQTEVYIWITDSETTVNINIPTVFGPRHEEMADSFNFICAWKLTMMIKYTTNELSDKQKYLPNGD